MKQGFRNNPVGSVSYWQWFRRSNPLLCRMSNIDSRIVVEEYKLFKEFKGAFTENYVLNVLTMLFDNVPNYYTFDRNEIDFVIQTDGYVIPVEVKATTNLQAKSLKVYREKFEPEISIRTSLADFEINNGLFNIPLFMAGKFDEILKDGR